MGLAPDARCLVIAPAATPRETVRLTALVPRLMPRSAGAVADTELLRVARTDIAPVAVARTGLSGRIRAIIGRRGRSAA